MVIPMLLLLAFGIVAVGRVVQAQMGVSAVAREASRAAALANDPAEAADRGIARGQAVGSGYRLWALLALGPVLLTAAERRVSSAWSSLRE